MRQNGLAVAIVLFVVLSAFVVLPGTVRGASSASGPSANPAATVTVETLDANGNPQSYFYSQTGFFGNVYFLVQDSSADKTATVTITDQNATRDGVAAPAISWTVSLPNTGTYNSVTSGQFYQIPVTVPYGGYWNVTVSAALGGTSSAAFYVQTYYVTMNIAPELILPGHSATVSFNVASEANSGPYTKVTSVKFGGAFFNTSFAEQSLTPTIISFAAGTSSGTFAFTLPMNADPDSFTETWISANISMAGVNNSVTYTYGLGVAALDVPSVFLSCVECFGSTVPANAQVLVEVVASEYYGTYTQPAVGLQAAFHFQSGTTPITSVPGNPAATVITNSEGDAAVLFNASPSVFLSNQSNHVIVNVTDPLNSAVSFNSSTPFTLIAASVPEVYLNVQLSQTFYNAGDVATVNWQLGGDTSGVTNGWTVFQYIAVIINPQSGLLTNITGTGALTGTGLTGSFQVQLPVGVSGTFEVEVLAHNATEAFGVVVGSTVYPALLVVYSSVYAYNPGQTVTFYVVTDGSVFTGSTLTYALYSATGFTLESGTLSGTSFSYSVPSTAPTNYLLASVVAQSPTLGVIASSGDEVHENVGYLIAAGVQTKSNYADNSYQPGQSLTLSYAISGINGAVLPSLFEVGVGPGGATQANPTMYFVTPQSSGTFSYTVPSNTPTGAITVEVGAYLPNCQYGSCFITTNLTLYVNSNPSVLNQELGAGSGLTVGWLILLIVAVLLFFIAIFLARRWSRRSSPPGPPMAYVPPASTAMTTSTTPPSEAGGEETSSPPAYSEGGDNSPPPLPPPSS